MVGGQAASGQGTWTRPHTLAEVFSTLADGRPSFRYLASDATALTAELTGRMKFVKLDVERTGAGRMPPGARRTRVHGWLHTRAATKGTVEILVTDNLADFTGLEDGYRLSAP